MRWDALRSDVGYAWRMAVKAPLFTTLAVATLALGIGANSAIFAVVHGVLLQPLPYQDPDRLMMVWSHDTHEGLPRNPISPANFVDLRDGSRAFAQLEGYFSFVTNSQIQVNGPPEIAATLAVTPGLFALLGRTAAIGRTFVADEDAASVLLSDGYWHRRFGADPTIVGRRVTLDGAGATVIGVMPPEFVFPYQGMVGPTGFTRTLAVDAWLPMQLTGPRMVDAAGRYIRNVHYLAAVARRQPASSVAQTRAGFAAIATRLELAYPDSNDGWATTVTPLHEQVVGKVRPGLLLLLVGVGVILLMACVNVANMVLARSLSRQKELAVRSALGASGGRLAQQALTESVMIAGTGALAGLVVARGLVQALVALAPADLPRLPDLAPNLTVLMATLGVALLSGVVVGVLPAVFAGRADPAPALQDASRGAIGSRGRHRIRASLVVVEVAMAVVLSVGAGLLIRSFATLLAVDPGFQPEHLITLQMSVPARIATPQARRAYYAEWLARLEALPGVSAVGGSTRIPLGSTSVTTSVQIEGRTVAVAAQPQVEFRRAMHNYFQAMGIPLLQGRHFSTADGPTAPPVALINQAMAQRLFPGLDPIGRRIRTGPDPAGPWITIVGVVGNVRHLALDAPPPAEMYINYLQNPPVAPFIAIRTAGNPALLAEPLRQAALAFDSSLAIYDIRTMAQMRAESVAERRFLLLLMGAFGVLALTLAGVGVYGVMALMVSERTQEVGVRLALGAAPASVLAMVIGQAIRLAAGGVAIGIAVAAALSPFLASQLFGIATRDVATFAVVPVVLMVVATAAAIAPARRASRVDPLTALRPPC